MIRDIASLHIYIALLFLVKENSDFECCAALFEGYMILSKFCLALSGPKPYYTNVCIDAGIILVFVQKHSKRKVSEYSCVRTSFSFIFLCTV